MVAADAEVHAEAWDDCAVFDNGLFDDATDAEDHCLRRVHDGVEGLDAPCAEVRDGDGAAIELIWHEFFVASTHGHFLDLFRNLEDGFLLGIFDDGSDEAVVYCDGNGDPDVGELDNVVAIIRSIRFRDGDGGIDERFDDKVIHGIFITVARFGLGIDLLTQGHERAGVDLEVEVEVRDGRLGNKKAISDDLTHRGKLDSLVLSAGNGGDGDGCCLGRSGCGRSRCCGGGDWGSS